MIFLMILHMNDILMLMIVMDIIPHYNYYILFCFRGVCICWDWCFDVMYSAMLCKYQKTI